MREINTALVLKKLVSIILLSYIGFGMVLFFFQNRYIYYPDQTDFANCPLFSRAERITHGDTRMYFSDHASDKVIVYYHGNAGRACDRYFLDSWFAEQGYATLFIEYTGYAETANAPSMNKIQSNVTDVIEYLKTKNFSSITVGGESLGVGPAAYHASLAPVDNLILITAYNNFVDVVATHYPVYPVRLMLRNNYTPDRWLTGYTGSVTLILAEHDDIIPPNLGQKLYQGILSNDKNLAIIQNVGHNSLYNSPDFYEALKKALR